MSEVVELGFADAEVAGVLVWLDVLEDLVEVGGFVETDDGGAAVRELLVAGACGEHAGDGGAVEDGAA